MQYLPHRGWAVMAFVALPVLFVSPSRAEGPVVRVEEDWELLVLRPQDAPVVATRMFPLGGASELVFQLDLNHGSVPELVPGGYQLHTNLGDRTLSTNRSLKGKGLKNKAERLSWTQVIQCSEDGFYYGVLYGRSQSWGAWGGAASFIYVSYADANRNDLQAYEPKLSIEKSGFDYGQQHLGQLKLKKVRVFRSGEPAVETKYR